MKAIRIAFWLLLIAATAAAQARRVLTQPFPTQTAIIYDDARDRLVAMLDDGAVWEWDGQSWALQVTRAPGPLESSCYDPVRGLCFVACASCGQGLVYAYDGHFTALPAVPSLAGVGLLVADIARGRIVAFTH